MKATDKDEIEDMLEDVYLMVHGLLHAVEQQTMTQAMADRLDYNFFEMKQKINEILEEKE